MANLVDWCIRVGRKLGTGGLFCRSSGPSLARPALHPWALVTAKQYPLPIPGTRINYLQQKLNFLGIVQTLIPIDVPRQEFDSCKARASAW